MAERRMAFSQENFIVGFPFYWKLFLEWRYVIFERLYNTYCTSYTPDIVPVYLRDNPMKTCAQYTFERGFRLGMQIAFTCIDPEKL